MDIFMFWNMKVQLKRGGEHCRLLPDYFFFPLSLSLSPLFFFRGHICSITQRGWKGHLGDQRLDTKQQWKPVRILRVSKLSCLCTAVFTTHDISGKLQRRNRDSSPRCGLHIGETIGSLFALIFFQVKRHDIY